MSGPVYPHDLPVGHTYEWIQHTLPRTARRVLEVGCGDGALAALLQSRGLRVTAIDESPEAVERARARGVDAIETDFATFADAPFDAVLFARVLHHLDGLDGTVARIADLVMPDGLVLVEDFSVEGMDRETVRWYYELASLLTESGLLLPADHEDPPQTDLLQRWFDFHAMYPPIHEGEAMLLALGKRFEIPHHSQPPYLYRYFCGHLAEGEHGMRIAQWIHTRERRRIEEGSLRAIGLRIAARKAR